MPAHFSGAPVTRWLANGRDMELVEPFSFTDSAGRVWAAPAGFVTDGASIPQALWAIVGGPYEGRYRLAAIVHDYVCVNHATIAERKLGDRMFREACIVAGCSEEQADILFRGVSIGTLEEQLRGHK